MNEIWKNIPGYEGMYQVSNIGRVKSLPKRYNPKGCILKSKTQKNKYYACVDLANGVNKKSFYIHQLMAMAFLGHKPDGTNKLVVDHVNNNKRDNRLENLQLISNRENSTKDRLNGTSKYIGVSFYKNTGKWRCQKYINGKLKHLGYFDSEIEANIFYNKN